MINPGLAHDLDTAYEIKRAEMAAAQWREEKERHSIYWLFASSIACVLVVIMASAGGAWLQACVPIAAIGVLTASIGFWNRSATTRKKRNRVINLAVTVLTLAVLAIAFLAT